ncbi:DUF3347 domain-containing protein [Runella salmonicolor]|uniref:DUF3347 domain-containing protein n=1 Tax=Runella salmonicolor TaxID=2950278 RepID=A0ABT1FXH8_9BACT|nr:DUF3347 domain-containing protein [Runella salmonicolor]MCP1386483.1 DUF3347 domain-containing protein [Runella salmonicolor]
MKKTIIFAFALLISAVSFAQHEGHNMTKMGIDPVLTAYFKVKNALVASDAKATAAEAKVLSAAVKKAGKMIGADAAKAADAMAKSSDIDTQRAQLGTLTTAVYAAAKAMKPGSTVYYDFCPMANNNTGGYWLSEKKEIANPYFGDAMLKCGKVKETL